MDRRFPSRPVPIRPRHREGGPSTHPPGTPGPQRRIIRPAAISSAAPTIPTISCGSQARSA